jgi:hypothetical protein
MQQVWANLMHPIRRFPLPNDFRKSVLFSSFNLKHPQISGLSWIFFLWKSTTISMVLEFFGLSKFHWIILKIFSGNAGSIELSVEKKNSWYSSLISSDDPSFRRLHGGMNWLSIDNQLASLTGVVDYQLIANSKLRFAKPRRYTFVCMEKR